MLVQQCATNSTRSVATLNEREGLIDRANRCAQRGRSLEPYALAMIAKLNTIAAVASNAGALRRMFSAHLISAELGARFLPPVTLVQKVSEVVIVQLKKRQRDVKHGI